MTNKSDPYDLANLRLPPEMVLASTPAKLRKRRQHFIKVPMAWYEGLKGAHGQTYRVAMQLLYLHWRNGAGAFKLANGMLHMDGVPRESKRRALQDLERRGLITIERQARKSPTVKLIPSP